MTFPPLPELPIHVRRSEEPSVSRPIERRPELGVFPNEMGIAVALRKLRVVTTHICVALDCFFVHEEGAHAQMRVVHRDPTTGDSPARDHTFFVRPQGIEPHRELWRTGLEFADGRRSFTPDINIVEGVDTDWVNDFYLAITGGGGDSMQQIYRLYLSPLPPPGPLTFHVELGAHGVHSVEADAAPLTEALAQLSPVIWDSRGTSS